MRSQYNGFTRILLLHKIAVPVASDEGSLLTAQRLIGSVINVLVTGVLDSSALTFMSSSLELSESSKSMYTPDFLLIVLQNLSGRRMPGFMLDII